MVVMSLWQGMLTLRWQFVIPLSKHIVKVLYQQLQKRGIQVTRSRIKQNYPKSKYSFIMTAQDPS
jgi:hypothetical protein